MCRKTETWKANNVDTDHFAAYYMGVHCLISPVCPLGVIMVTQFKDGQQNVASKQKCIDYKEKMTIYNNLYILVLIKHNKTCVDYIEKWPFMVIYLYNLGILVSIKHNRNV